MKKQNEAASLIERLRTECAGIRDYFRKLVTMPDQHKAEKLAEDYVTESAETVIGEEKKQLTLDIAESKEHAAQLKKQIVEQRRIVASTDKTVLQRDVRKKESSDEQEQHLRKVLDIGLGVFCMLCGFAALGISMSTMFTVVMSQGNPVFLENEALAWAMSSVLGLGAFAFEFFKRYMRTDRAKRYYGISMYVASAALLITWILMFAILFGSAADQALDMSDLLSDDGSDNGDDAWMTAFTVIQLLAEFFVGCTFFMTGGDLFAKYSPMRRVPNTIYIDAKKLLDELQKEFEGISAELHAKEARLGAIESAVSLFVKEQMAEYYQIRAQLVG